MKLADRVYNILSQIEFLVFRGGGGGEFLSSLIYKYSNSYHNEEVVTSSNTTLNKTSIYYPSFFSEIANSPQQNANILNILSQLKEEYITEAEDFLSRRDKFIARMHYVNNTILINRSIFMLLDEKKWFDYAGLLVAYKNQLHTDDISIELNSHERKFGIIFGDKEVATRKIINYMASNNLEKISSLKLSLIYSNKLDIDEVLVSDIQDLYFKYGNIVHGEHEYYRNAMLRKPWKKIINFSNIFTKGYLEDIFDISGDEFHEELLTWHEKNLILLESKGIDIAEFKS